MEEKLDEIIALLTQLPDTLHSFMTSKYEDEAEPLKEDESEPLKEDESEPLKEEDESENKEKDLGMDYLEF